MADERVKFIIDQLNAAAQETALDKQPPEIGEEESKMIEFVLKVFDRMLPMLISHVIAEYDRQCSRGAS